jgi:hypothetical protein
MRKNSRTIATTAQQKGGKMPQLWSRRHVLRTFSLTGATLLRPALLRSQPWDAMARAALAVLESFSAQQRRQAVYPFESEGRRDWHYIPRRRPGIPLGELQPTQHELVWALLRVGLSQQGVQKTQAVIDTEAILGELSGSLAYRDPTNYALVFFGDPASGRPWSWRFEGHHLSLSFTIVPGQGVATTPAFLGANPATVPSPHAQAGFTALETEATYGFRLLHSFSETQKASALLQTTSFGDILSGPGRETSLKQRAGLALGNMTASQRQQAMALVETYVRNARPEVAQAELDSLIAAGIDSIHFAWAGSQTPQRPHYYRLHGPTLLIEYDNTQNGANHVHSVWHNPSNSFGQDLLQAHYQDAHPPAR